MYNLEVLFVHRSMEENRGDAAARWRPDLLGRGQEDLDVGGWISTKKSLISTQSSLILWGLQLTPQVLGC